MLKKMSSSENDEIKTSILIAIILIRRRKRKKKRQARTTWVRTIFRKRYQQGEYLNLLQEMRICHPDSHFSFLGMSKATFDSLLQRVGILEQL